MPYIPPRGFRVTIYVPDLGVASGENRTVRQAYDAARKKLSLQLSLPPSLLINIDVAFHHARTRLGKHTKVSYESIGCEFALDIERL